MHEIAPGLFGWTTFHEEIEAPVHTHFHVPSGTLLDPRVPEGGLDAVAAVGRPERIVLTNRLHFRHSAQFFEAFGCEVLCEASGLDDLQGRGAEVRGFEFGDVLAPGVRAVAVGAITPEEAALHLDVGPGFLALADVVQRGGGAGEFAFFEDELLGDDPEAVKRAMVAALRRLLDEEAFEGLLLAHGDPLPTGGRAALEAFVARASAEWPPTS